MAQSNFLESGEIRPVYYPMGNFNNDQRPRYVRAPFVFLILGGSECLMPTGGASTAIDYNNLLSSDTFALEQYMGRLDFGLESADDIVVGEHELGTGRDGGWKGVHRFGFI